eukprot:scaffold570874_cov24-Prasinocladus_malaysianus.AAC.1
MYRNPESDATPPRVGFRSSMASSSAAFRLYLYSGLSSALRAPGASRVVLLLDAPVGPSV